MREHRAVWVKFIEFTPEQRLRFHGILKKGTEETDQYINRVQRHIRDYVIGNTSLRDSPPESAEECHARLTSIAVHSKALWEDITNLDENGSGHRLWLAQLRLSHPTFNVNELEEPLMFLAAISAGAAQWDSERSPGRPPNNVNYRFIAACISEYLNVFKKHPKYTKGTKFQNFLKAVSEEICPPEMALRGDITKTIQAAIDCGKPKE